MSFKFTSILFEKAYTGRGPELLRRLNVSTIEIGGRLTFAQALHHAREGTALGAVNGKTVLLDPFLSYDVSWEPHVEGPLDAVLTALSLEGDLSSYVVDGISGTYCFCLFSGGKRARRWATEPGHVWTDEGEPIAGEEIVEEFDVSQKRTVRRDPTSLSAVSRDESHLFSVWEAFLGVAFQRLLRDERLLFRGFV